MAVSKEMRDLCMDSATFRQMAQTSRYRSSFNWRKLLSSATCRIRNAATRLTGRIVTCLENHINLTRTSHVRRRQYKVMNRHFKAALHSCYKQDKVSKKEMKEAKRRWKKAMKDVREEDERRKNLWGGQECAPEPNI